MADEETNARIDELYRSVEGVRRRLDALEERADSVDERFDAKIEAFKEWLGEQLTPVITVGFANPELQIPAADEPAAAPDEPAT